MALLSQFLLKIKLVWDFGKVHLSVFLYENACSVPSQNFKVSDVKQCVGSRRVLDVMDVNTQKVISIIFAILTALLEYGDNYETMGTIL